MPIRFAPVLWTMAAMASAADKVPSASTGNLLQVLLGLVTVLGCMAAVAWMLRRFGVAKSGTASAIKVVAGVNIGTRERVLVVEVADHWIVVGVAPGRVNTLMTMPRQEGAAALEAAPRATKSFSVWLKQTIEKPNEH